MKEVTYEKIVDIVQAQIEDNEITFEQYDNDLQELGMDSLKFIQIIVALEEEFECEIPDAKILLLEMNTINKMYFVLTNDALGIEELDN